MTAKPLIHRSFVLERTYDATPARVYAAWANPEHKAQWFVGPNDWTVIERTNDLRVGGGEVVHGRFPNGMESKYVSTYHEIVEGQRLVYVYDMYAFGRFMSVSLATMEVTAVAGGTRLVYSEQIAFVDGEDGSEGREQGTIGLLDNFARYVPTVR